MVAEGRTYLPDYFVAWICRSRSHLYTGGGKRTEKGAGSERKAFKTISRYG